LKDLLDYKAKVTIAGAGPVGSLLAIILSRAGYRVEVFESRPDPRTHSAPQGKSINITLSERAWQALDHIGFAEQVRQFATPIYKKVIHYKENALSQKSYGDKHQVLWSISRENLTKLLLEKAQKEANISLHFEQRLTHIDFLSGCCSFSYLTSGKRDHREIDADLVFAADGAFSKVRRLAQETPRFSYSQHYMEQCYVELTIAANADGSAKLLSNAYHLWPRENVLLIALPNSDGSFTCTLYLNYQGKVSFSSLNTTALVTEFFEEYFADIYPLLEHPVTEFLAKTANPLFLVSVDPWVFNNKVSLIGDAAHAMVPFFGQGLNCSFEDCHQLALMIQAHQHDWQKILPAYYKQRKNNADAISKLSKTHFADLSAQALDNIDNQLANNIVDKFTAKQPLLWPSLEKIILFQPEVSYAKAREVSAQQQKIMKEIMKIDDIHHCWQQPWIYQQIELRAKELIAPLLKTAKNKS